MFEVFHVKRGVYSPFGRGRIGDQRWLVQCTPHFLFFFQKKTRKRAVHGPKEKKKYMAFLPVEHPVGAAALGGPSPRNLHVSYGPFPRTG